ncbi:MAG: hypothetical protein ACTHK4_04590, partial [Mycobacteriales bacterium]
VTFRAPLTRAARGVLCLLVAIAVAWAIHAELVFYGLDTTLRAIALTPTIVLEIALIVGLWRLWVVCLIVDDSGVTVRNFRGDIRLRRFDVREVVPAVEASGCHVVLQLKTGDKIHLDGLAFATAGRTNRAVQEISQAMGLVRPPAEP